MSSANTPETTPTPTVYHIRLSPFQAPPGRLLDLCVNAWVHTGQPNRYAKLPELPAGKVLSPEPLPTRVMGINIGSGRKYFSKVVREGPEDPPHLFTPGASALPLEPSMPVGGTILGPRPSRSDLESVIGIFALAEIEEQTLTILDTVAVSSLCTHITDRTTEQPVRQLNEPVALLAQCTLLAAVAGKDAPVPMHGHLSRRKRKVTDVKSPFL